MAYGGRNSSPNNSGRRVVPSTSLSSRFQQLSRRDANSSRGGRTQNSSRPPAPSRQRVSLNVRKPVGASSRGPVLNRRGGRNRAFNSASREMDIDSGRSGSNQNRNGPRRGDRGHAPHTNRANGQQEGRDRRGNSRRGRGGRQGIPKKGPVSQANLDMDLDNYMLRDTNTGRSVLDNDLDSYMQSKA